MNNIEKMKLFDKIEKCKSIDELFCIRQENIFDLDIEKACSIRLFKITKDYSHFYGYYLFSTFYGLNKPDDFFSICNKEHQRHKTDPVLLSVLSVCYFVGGDTFEQDITKAVFFSQKALKYQDQYIKPIQYIIRSIASSIFILINDEAIQNNGLEIMKKLLNNNFYEDNDLIYRQISFCYLLQGKTKKALEYCNKIKDCSSSYINLLKGICSYQEKDFTNSFVYFKKVLTDPHDSYNEMLPAIMSEEKDFLNIARTYVGMMMLEGKGTKRDTESGIKILENCLNNGCTYVGAIIGNYYFSINDFDKAIFYYLKSANSKPFSDACSFYMLAKIYKEKYFNAPPKEKDKLKEQSIIYYKKAIELGKYEVKINLAKFYIKLSHKNKSFLVMAEEELYEAQKLGIKQADEELKKLTAEEETKNIAEKYLYEMKKYTKNPDDLYNKIENRLTRKYAQYISKISSKAISSFTGSIYDAIIHLDDKGFIDYSSLIGSLSKGLELIIKQQILKNFKMYLYNEHIPSNEIEFIVPKDVQNVGEVKFTLKNLSEIKEKQYFKNFAVTHLNVSLKTYDSRFDEIINLINEFNSVRNPATHSAAIYLKRYINCLNIVIFEKDLVGKILKLLK